MRLPHSGQNQQTAVPPLAVGRCQLFSSPESSWKCSLERIIVMLNELADNFWQSVQWHTSVASGGPSS
jgi:hypothetical protein